MSKYNYTVDVYAKRYKDMQTYITAYDFENLEAANQCFKAGQDEKDNGDLTSYDLVNIRLMTYDEDLIDEFYYSTPDEEGEDEDYDC